MGLRQKCAEGYNGMISVTLVACGETGFFSSFYEILSELLKFFECRGFKRNV